MRAPVLLGAAVVAYPFIVYLGLTRAGLAAVAIVLVAISVARVVAGSGRATRRVDILLGVGGLALASSSLARDSVAELLLYPVFINATLFTVFAYSLIHPPTIIERIARLRHGELAAPAVRYTRNVTVVWCGFFALNGAIAYYTARFASMEAWMIYNGFVSYVLIGLLFAGEWLIRRRVMRQRAA